MASMNPDGDRAQLVLIGALAIAVSLVAIALVLNSAIYTHNLASRYDASSDDATTLVRDVRIAAGGAIDYANENNSNQGFSDINSGYERGLSDVEDGIASQMAPDGRMVKITPFNSREGVRVVDRDGPFLPRSGTGGDNEWTVAKDVHVRQFDVTVSRNDLAEIDGSTAVSQLANPSTDNAAFLIEATDGSTDIRIVLYNNTTTGKVNVRVRQDGTTFPSCEADGRVRVHLGAAQLGNIRCGPLHRVEDLETLHTIRFYNGDKASGAYELTADWVVTDPTGEVGPFTHAVDTANYDQHCGGPTYFPADSTEYPRVSPAIYNSSVEVAYDSPEVTYVGNQRVAPEEFNRSHGPRVTDIQITDNDNSQADFTVDWVATDPDGDFTSVDIELLDSSGTVLDTVSSSNPDGDETVTHSSDGTFTIRVTVIDANGNSRTLDQTHESDGDGLGCAP